MRSGLGIGDRIVLVLARQWCRLRHFRVVGRTARRAGMRPDPATPTTDIDKFLWRKLFDRNPLFAIACDKLAAKDYALSKCPGLKTAKVLWSGTDPDAIPADLLDGNVVVKANHGCRWNVLVRNGSVDRDDLRKTIAHWMGRRYGRSSGEWAYGGARRLVLVEEMLLDRDVPVRSEYKFHVGGGRVAYVFVSKRADDGSEARFYTDRDGTVVPAAGKAAADGARPSPEHARMVGIAERLAEAFDFVRVDLYEIGGEIFFSELTVYPLSGKGGSNPRLRDIRNASWDIRRSWFLSHPQRGWRRVYAGALRRWCDLADRPQVPRRR